MTSKIKKAGEIPTRESLRMCIFAPTGLGKTTLACSAPSPLLIDTDQSAYRLHQAHQVDTLEAYNYSDILDVLNNYDLNPYDTLIFDTIGKLLEGMGDYLRRIEPKYDDGGTVSRSGYGVISSWFKELCSHEALADKNIIFIGHQDNTSRSDKPYYEPMSIGKNFARLATELDLVGHIEMYGEKRTLTFNPSEMYAGKNTCNLPAKMEIPLLINESGEIITDNNFLSVSVIDPYFKRQAEMKVQRETFNKLVEQFTSQLSKAKSPAEFNTAVESISQYEHIGSSRLKMESIAESEAFTRGYTKNPKTGKYGTLTAK